MLTDQRTHFFCAYTNYSATGRLVITYNTPFIRPENKLHFHLSFYSVTEIYLTY